MVNATVERKEATWKKALSNREEVAKMDIWRFTKEKTERLKAVNIRAKKKKKANEQFGRKMNQDIDWNRK